MASLIFDVRGHLRLPKPVAPSDAPPGTVTIGGPVEWFVVAIRIRGPKLDPARVTQLLGVTPSRAVRRGERIHPPIRAAALAMAGYGCYL